MTSKLAAAVPSPGDMFVSENKRKKEIDISQFHVSLAHAHVDALKTTGKQHGTRLVGELAPSSVCLAAKGIRAATPRHLKIRARAPMELVFIDTAGPYPQLLGRSRYVAMFVDGASRLQRPHGTRDKSTPATLAVVKRFVADLEFLARSGPTPVRNRPAGSWLSTAMAGASASS